MAWAGPAAPTTDTSRTSPSAAAGTSPVSSRVSAVGSSVAVIRMEINPEISRPGGCSRLGRTRDARQVVAQHDLAVEMRPGDGAPLLFLAAGQVRHVVGQHQRADAGALCGL